MTGISVVSSFCHNKGERLSLFSTKKFFKMSESVIRDILLVAKTRLKNITLNIPQDFLKIHYLPGFGSIG